MEMTKQELVQLVENTKAGNGQAYEYLYNVYYNDVYYTCFKLLGNEKNAEDITQDTFVEGLVSINTLSESEKFPSWLTKVAANKSLDFLRKNNRLISADNEELDKFADVEDFAVSLDNRMIDEDVKTTLTAIINRLPEIQRNTLFLFYYRNMSIKEIAELYGCPESTVKSRLAYARKFMKAQIEGFENQDYRFRCNAALPFLAALFGAEQNNTAVPPHDLPTALSPVAGSTAVHTAASAAGNTVVQATVSAGLSTGVKIAIVSMIAAAVITGGVITMVMLSNGQSDQQTLPPAEESIIAESSVSNESDTAMVSADSSVAADSDTEISADEQVPEDVSLKALAEKMKAYTAEYIDFSGYTENDEDLESHYYIRQEKISAEPKSADEVIFDIELINSLTFGIGTPYSELRENGYVSENYDEDMVESGSTKYIYVFDQSIGKTLYIGINNDSGGSIAAKYGKIAAFEVENTDRYAAFDYHGITKRSSIKDVAEILGEPDSVSIAANQYEDSTIELVYQNRDNYKKLKITFLFDRENSKMTNLGVNLFLNCTNLKEVYLPAEIKTIGKNITKGCGDDLVLYVKAGSSAEEYAKTNDLNYKTY